MEAYRKGAKNTLGWRKSIYAPTMNNWLNRYTNNLKDGMTIWNAMVNASAAIVVDNDVKDIGFYGSASNTIKSVDAPAIMSMQEDSLEGNDNVNLFHVSENITFSNTSGDIENLTNFINSKYPLSEKENYDVQIHEINKDQGLYIIDFIRMINNAYTDLGYVVFVKENKVESIADDNKIVITRDNSLLRNKNMKNINEYKQEAIQHLKEINNKYNVTDQRVQLYLDVDTNKYYYRIFSTYEVEDGFVAVDCYLAEI